MGKPRTESRRETRRFFIWSGFSIFKRIFYEDKVSGKASRSPFEIQPKGVAALFSFRKTLLLFEQATFASAFFRLFYALFTIIPLWITVDNSTFTRVRTGVRGQKSCRLRENRSDFLRRFYLSTPKFKIFKIKKQAFQVSYPQFKAF